MRALPKLSLIQQSISPLILLFLCVTLIASAALCVLAWRLVILDRAVAQQREWERLEHAADSGSGLLLQRLNDTGVRLRSAVEGDDQRRITFLQSLADDCSSCLTIFLKPEGLAVIPNRKLRYVP